MHFSVNQSRDLLRHTYKVKESSQADSTGIAEKAFDPELTLINDEWNRETKVAREQYYQQAFSEKLVDNLSRREDYDRQEAERIEKLKNKLLSIQVFAICI